MKVVLLTLRSLQRLLQVILLHLSVGGGYKHTVKEKSRMSGKPRTIVYQTVMKTSDYFAQQSTLEKSVGPHSYLRFQQDTAREKRSMGFSPSLE